MNKLYRSKDNKIISGVFGGLSEYLNIDVNIVRLLGLTIFISQPVAFLILYIASTVIIPVDTGIIEASTSEQNANTPFFLGVTFIIVGISFLLRIIFPAFQFNIFYQLRMLIRKVSNLWPILLVILGIYLIANNDKEN